MFLPTDKLNFLSGQVNSIEDRFHRGRDISASRETLMTLDTEISDFTLNILNTATDSELDQLGTLQWKVELLLASFEDKKVEVLTQTTEENFPLMKLPPEIIKTIFSFCVSEDRPIVRNLFSVSKDVNALISDQALWSNFCTTLLPMTEEQKIDFQNLPAITDFKNYFQKYQLYHIGGVKNGYQLNVRLLSGQSLGIDYNSKDKVINLKYFFCKENKLSYKEVDNIKIIYAGYEKENDYLLQSFGVNINSITLLRVNPKK